jgi:hypothetical protein
VSNSIDTRPGELNLFAVAGDLYAAGFLYGHTRGESLCDVLPNLRGKGST